MDGEGDITSLTQIHVFLLNYNKYYSTGRYKNL